MSKDDSPVTALQDKYSIHITLPEKRLSSAISAEVQIATSAEVGFNQLLYNVVQKPIDDKSPVMIPPGKYTLRLEATLLERVDEEPAPEEEEPVEELKTIVDLSTDRSILQSLVEEANAPSPEALRARGKGKGAKTAAPRTSGGVPVKPKRARRR